MESMIYTSSMEILNLQPSDCIKSGETTMARVEEIPFEAVAPSLGFLDLPREIRDQIYEILFLSENRTVYPSKSRAGSISEAIGLLRTNSRVYLEAVEILYGQNMFQIRGDPAYKAPEFLHLLIFRTRKEGLYRPIEEHVCLASHRLKRLSIPSHGVSLDRLKHLFSLMKYLSTLEHIQVIYLGKRGGKDMDVVSVCRLLRDRIPLLKTFVLGKRVNYTQAEDISWMVSERPYRSWSIVFDEADDGRAPTIAPGSKEGHIWSNELGEKRQAKIILAPQQIPE